MISNEQFEKIDRKATQTATTEANEMVFDSPKEREKWITSRGADLFWEYIAEAEARK